MSIGFRILLVVLIAAFVPFGALGFVVQRSFVEGLKRDHQSQLESRVRSAKRRIEQMHTADRESVSALCQHDMLIDRLVIDLATRRFTPERQQAMVTLMPPLMRGRRFDVLALLDASRGAQRGRLLGAGHYPERVGAQEAALLSAFEQAAQHPFVADVRVWNGERRQDRATLLNGCLIDRDGARVAVLAGRFIDGAMSDELTNDAEPVHFELVRAGPPPAVASSVVVEDFASATGAVEWQLRGWIDSAPLEAEIATLQARGLWIGALALIGALLLALFFAWYLTRPLRALESAAQRVGKGDLESQMQVRRRDEMGSVMSAFNQMTKELSSTRRKLLRAERIAAWREVARRIAHEIKNPLQPIQMEVETLRKLHERKHPDFDSEFKGSTGVILDEVRRLDNMVTEFSKFARLPRPNPKSVDCREILQSVAGLHQADDARLAVQVPDAPTIIRADRDQLTQVFVNLIQNGIEAARARQGASGGEVEVELTPVDRGVRIEIADNGPGIGAEDRMKIFEPYFTTKASGTGLGLAIVHRIVGDHGGTIDVDESPSGGARFTILLPEEGPPAGIEATLGDTAIPLGRSRRP